MKYRAEKMQSEAFDKQQVVLGNLQKSSDATASILGSLKSTTEIMNQAIQDEANLNYKIGRCNVRHGQQARTHF